MDQKPLGDLEAEQPDQDRLVRAGLVFYGAMAVAAVLWRSAAYREPIWVSAPIPAEPWSHGAALGLGVGVGLAIVAVSYVWTENTRWGRDLAIALAAPLAGLSAANAMLLAFASGLAEEMLFRGAMQPRWGWVVASLAFGLVHFVPRRELLPWTVFAIAVGFLLGWLFELTGSLAAPVAAHIVVNAVNLPLLIQRYGGSAGQPPDHG